MKTPDIIKDTDLSELKTGEEGVIIKVSGHGAFRKRITEMGFVKGKKVRVIKNAPLQDPVEYEIMGYNVSLRRTEARLVKVVIADISVSDENFNFSGTLDEETLKVKAHEKGRDITVALVGNPNSGKTTLYNWASGSHERVGNYGGVTVNSSEAEYRRNSYIFRITDLPGTYSITEYTPEEKYVRAHIAGANPDVVVNVVDASNLERNLFLTTQLIDMNIKVVIALNMSDELESKGIEFNYDALGKMIGIPIIPTVATKGNGVENLFDKIIEVYEDRDPAVRHIHINYGQNIESAISQVQQYIKENKNITDRFSSRYLALKLLESDRFSLDIIREAGNHDKIIEICDVEIKKLETEYNEKVENIITDAKYGFISGALRETSKTTPENIRRKIIDIDYMLTHRYFGFPIFMLFMWVMFQATFSLGKYPMDLIDMAVKSLGEVVQNIMTPGPLRDLLVDGIIGGVGGVIIFLPNILILFFFISFMEDTGYMARTAFIMDKLMHIIGLHGKSFIPMLMGFGCNVPAIMATRTLENKKDRVLTMLIIPFMSCSARLPIYVLLISAFFPENQGLVLVGIYLAGILLAVLSALVLKKLFFTKKSVPFVMELPPYRIPTLKNTLIHMWHKGVQYIKKMGSIILIASVLIWALGYFPRNTGSEAVYEAEITTLQNNPWLTQKEKNEQVNYINLQKESQRHENSYIGRIGHFIEPVISPLGFDWKIGVCIITGLAAKEIVVSSMAVLYQAEYTGENHDSGNLKNRLKEQVHSHGKLKGKKVFTPLVALTMMLFILIYFPCIASIAAIKKEAGWVWAMFTMIYTTGIAWVVAFLTYQVGLLIFY